MGGTRLYRFTLRLFALRFGEVRSTDDADGRATAFIATNESH
jgi:hypothetical protein